MKPLLQQRKALLDEKLQVDGRIAAINLELARASAQYHETGKGMDRERYFKLKSELVALKPKSQTLQRDLGEVSRALRHGDQKTLGEYFLEIARIELPTEQFEKLLHTALELRDGRIR